MLYQTTLAKTVTCEGLGLHTGRSIRMTLRPAEAGSGIVFHRREDDQVVSIEAVSANVVDTRLATVLGKNGLSVSTVEHLLGALRALGIDNLHIDIDGPEVPVMDGSAAPFINVLRTAGLVRQRRERKYLVIRKPLTVVDGEKSVSVAPSRFFRISCEIDFKHPMINRQSRSLKIDAESFVKEIAGARTFGFLREVEYLKSIGLCRGGSLENAVVLSDQGILNPEGVRWVDEFVRHKILDAVGDLSLVGYPIIGHVTAVKPGHDMNHRFVEALLAAPDCWHLVSATPEVERSFLAPVLPILSPEPVLAGA